MPRVSLVLSRINPPTEGDFLFTQLTDEYIRERLTNQAPRSEAVHKALDDVTAAGIEYGKVILAMPAGPDQMLAMRLLEDLSARVKRGIALNQGFYGG